VNRLAARQDGAIKILFVARARQADDKPVYLQMRREIRVGKHGMHAVKRQRLGTIDALNGCMAMRASDKSRMQLIAQ